MKGTFKITLDYLKQLDACRDGQRAFQRAFPDGGAYQEVLDRCASEGRVDFGEWLLRKIGPTEDIRVYEAPINDEQMNIIFAGHVKFESKASMKTLIAGWGIEAGWGIKAGLGIKAGEGIKAGLGIKAGEGIKAGLGIEAGWDIKAGLGIEAGDDWGIYAGLNVPLSQGRSLAIVTAQEKPKNLKTGFWKENQKEEAN